MDPRPYVQTADSKGGIERIFHLSLPPGYDNSSDIIRYLQIHGIDRRMWIILHWNPDRIHSSLSLTDRIFGRITRTTDRKDEVKPSKQLMREVIHSGDRYECDGHVYAVQGDYGFDFRITDKKVVSNRQKVILSQRKSYPAPASDPPHPSGLEAIITVRNNYLGLDYIEYYDSAKFPPKKEGAQIDNPHLIVFIEGR